MQTLMLAIDGDRGGQIITPRLTSHLNTNLWLVQQFQPGRFECDHTELLHVRKLE